MAAPTACYPNRRNGALISLLAEAISHVSGRRLLVLDRMDVLDAPGRNDLIFWLADMADANAFDTARARHDAP